ncbi:MAG: SRPBCC domain-containing protein [Actinomycetota bacterium]|nr:SRPBCC domain-containing protein [Actinomycetota bacterium]
MAPHPDPIPIDGITIVREFEAPIESVFDAWVTPRQFAVWFGAENGEIPVESVQLDATPGGVWKATMFAGPARSEIHWIGEFVTVSRPNRLVIAFSDQPLTGGSPAGGWGYLTVLLDDLAGRTRMTFHQGGGALPPEQLAEAKAGWMSFFEVLDTLLRESQLD